MKHLSFLFLLLACSVSLTVRAQLPQTLTELHVFPDSVDWTALETKSEQDLVHFLAFAFADTSHAFCGGAYSLSYKEGTDPAYFREDHGPSVHLLDLDSDNDLDVIYDGNSCQGFDWTGVMVFLRDNDQYTEVADLRGTVVSVEHSTRKGTTLTVHKYPCCEDARTTVTIIDIPEKQKNTQSKTPVSYGFVRLRKAALSVLSETRYVPFVEFEVRSEAALLVYSPLLDMSLLSKGNRGTYYSPFIATYPPGTQGTVLGNYTDSKGIHWLFVSIPGKTPVTETIFNKSHSQLTCIYGWLRASENIGPIQ